MVPSSKQGTVLSSLSVLFKVFFLLKIIQNVLVPEHVFIIQDNVQAEAACSELHADRLQKAQVRTECL